ncbi:MAG: hypothetical protein P0Y50_08820 [Candidatus Brevundimonas colombiensis]|uniref:Uncharacterized protein n=1 Tax=Candidatus Brevundimonas colombiensis TaxID=3121376 RepID=A0AAJ5WYK3_9CAUL|nr:hypothetical protein [Brevundimonas sp.]WEK38654.1 MAG: hypothetical protein P0Y50_08820 [Brevundimonas sp.]
MTSPLEHPVVAEPHDGILWKVLAEIAAERQRQVALGHSLVLDDAYIDRELARAAGAYALDAAGQTHASLYWPWPGHSWQPGDQRRDLVRAAALAVAEIERLDREAAVAEGLA